MQPHPAEASIGETDGMQGGIDLLRRAQVFVEPLVVNYSFHTPCSLMRHKAVTI